MKQSGIINPFKEPEPEKERPNFFSKQPEPEQPPDNLKVHLDGDSFGLSFEHVDEDADLGDQLAKLLQDVDARFRGELREYGIKVLRPTIAYVAEPGEMVMRSKSAVIVVATGDVQNESTAFRRISHALHALPIRGILEKYHAKLHVRG